MSRRKSPEVKPDQSSMATAAARRHVQAGGAPFAPSPAAPSSPQPGITPSDIQSTISWFATGRRRATMATSRLP
ncbi:hypothetical protein C7389_101261 [Azoarcus indigens]|uniref:Uncharacterized protein n=1 Tax=Azoarcus indigens TaxID=29545 RepID=A0A4R6EF29_9RHOO|nr:hypothetical protein C7389_101261 [Azoarcus indigens]